MRLRDLIRGILSAVLKKQDSEEPVCSVLAGFGSGNPVTEDNYTDNETVTHKGHACAIIRSGYEQEKLVLQISCGDMVARELLEAE